MISAQGKLRAGFRSALRTDCAAFVFQTGGRSLGWFSTRTANAEAAETEARARAQQLEDEEEDSSTHSDDDSDTTDTEDGEDFAAKMWQRVQGVSAALQLSVRLLAAGHVSALRLCGHALGLDAVEAVYLMLPLERALRFGHDDAVRWVLETQYMADQVLQCLQSNPFMLRGVLSAAIRKAAGADPHWFMTWMEAQLLLPERQNDSVTMHFLWECVKAAAKAGDANAVRHAYARATAAPAYRAGERADWDDGAALLGEVLKGGSVDALIFLEAVHAVPQDANYALPEALIGCARGGHLPMIEFLATRPQFSRRFTAYMCDAAAVAGQLNVVEWLVSRRRVEGFTKEALSGAIDLRVVEFPRQA